MLPMEEVITDAETVRRKRRSAEYNMPTLTMVIRGAIFYYTVRTNLDTVCIVPWTKYSQINELTKKVLLSIEAAQMTNEDNGKCLWYSLCETSKYSRSLKNNQKMWLPVWKYAKSCCLSVKRFLL